MRLLGLHQTLSAEALRFAATLKSPDQISKPLSEEAAIENFTDQVDKSTLKARETSNWLLEVTKAVKHLGKHERFKGCCNQNCTRKTSGSINHFARFSF